VPGGTRSAYRWKRLAREDAVSAQAERDSSQGYSRLRQNLPDLGAAAVLLSLTLLLYLPYATKAGWFLDDWAVYAQQQDSGSYFNGLTSCMDAIPGGRKLACVYHTTEWWLLGDHRWAYHLTSIVFLFAIAVLAYAIARRASLGRVWSLAIGAAIVVFPGADTTRLFPVASIGQYAIMLQMASLLVAIWALERPWGRKSGALHVLSVLLAVLAMATYEIAVPLVAVQGAVYVAIFRNRRAFARWMADLGLVLAFVVYRLTLAPAENPAFMVERTTGQLVTRAGTLLEGAWITWRGLYAPGIAFAGLIGVLCVAAVATALNRGLRSRLSRWWLLLAAASVAAAACAGVFLTAEDLYVPQIASTYNRVNLPGTIPYVLAFIAVLGLMYELIRFWSRLAWVAPIAVLVAMLGVAAHQIVIGTRHQDSWLDSWSTQRQALPGVRTALRGVPHEADVFGFDTPQWEHDWIPIVAQTWDFRGMIEYETEVDPDYASPFRKDVSCGSGGIEQVGAVVAPYLDRTHPVYFVSPSRAVAVHVTSRQQCEQMLHSWGRVPLFEN
jgi:hypothetical protein